MHTAEVISGINKSGHEAKTLFSNRGAYRTTAPTELLDYQATLPNYATDLQRNYIANLRQSWVARLQNDTLPGVTHWG